MVDDEEELELVEMEVRELLDQYVLFKDEGGRHTPFFKGCRPHFISGQLIAVELPEGVETVMPGDNIKMDVTLINIEM